MSLHDCLVNFFRQAEVISVDNQPFHVRETFV
jgi:hypothetical protein